MRYQSSFGLLGGLGASSRGKPLPAAVPATATHAGVGPADEEAEQPQRYGDEQDPPENMCSESETAEYD
jgi:hypothetical protein